MAHQLHHLHSPVEEAKTMKQLQCEVYYLESACMFVWFSSDELVVLLLRTLTDVVGNPVADS